METSDDEYVPSNPNKWDWNELLCCYKNEEIIEVKAIQAEENPEGQHVKYIDELLWLLEDARRVAYGEAGLSVLAEVINEMSDGIPQWLEQQKKKPPHIEVWSEGELLIGSGIYEDA